MRLSGGNEKIILKASAEADSQALYWYVDNRYIGKESPARSINWSPKPGLFTVRAVDDKGRASSVRVHVAVTE